MTGRGGTPGLAGIAERLRRRMWKWRRRTTGGGGYLEQTTSRPYVPGACEPSVRHTKNTDNNKDNSLSSSGYFRQTEEQTGAPMQSRHVLELCKHKYDFELFIPCSRCSTGGLKADASSDKCTVCMDIHKK